MHFPAAPGIAGRDHRHGQSHAHEITACRQCGTFQRLWRVPVHTAFFCRTCTTLLTRTRLRNRRAALACTLAALLLFVPANLLPFLTTHFLGGSRESLLASSAAAMFGNGWPELAIVMALFILVLPFVRFILLAAVLGSLELGRRPPWLGRAFRYATALETWAMCDVFLLGLAVSYARLQTSIDITLGVGAMCFIAVGILTLFVRAMLDKDAVWQQIVPSEHAGVASEMVACPGCEMVLPQHCEGQGCPRCQATVRRRKPDAVGRAIALTLAGVLLYIPANIYPMATLPSGFKSVQYTIMQGVVDLADAKLLGLALLVFTASFAIPVLKLAGLSWCILSVLLKSRRHLMAKTWVYRVVEEIGRWSMVDPFVIACFVPVTGYNARQFGRADAAAPIFTAVVILTIVAARCFDSRLMWDRPGARK
ncbi:MAG: paraquat-inducible protein A [Pseudomonadota bacterium]